MLKSGQDRPNTSSLSKLGQKERDHWLQNLNTVVLAASADGNLNFSINGGSDNGEFSYIQDATSSKINYISGILKKGDVILEIEGQKIAGYTLNDTVAWLNHCCHVSNRITLQTAPAGSITHDLCEFLNLSFQKGSVDHDLQNTIRDNLYLRTVPVTTRLPRNGEVNGVDYTFLSPEEFFQLQKSGCLLESGIYEGNHYGTPKPAKETHCIPDQKNNISNVNSVLGLIPGAHPSSEGKRKRNRSNVEAMASKNLETNSQQMADNDDGIGKHEKMAPPNYYHHSNNDNSDPLLMDLGPLPPKWEKAYTEKGEVYFIDHNSGTSHWLDPRLSKLQKKSLEDCSDDELPYGWERINDPLYGTYYIDHVNRQTQYENPVIQAKSARSLRTRNSDVSNSVENVSPSRKHLNNNGFILNHPGHGSLSNTNNYSLKSKNSNDETYFTLNPNELMGERIHSTLVKSLRGLGITIVGGDDSKEEFLQIKSVVPNGPAWLEGKLQTGDVLVYVNDKCVLGYTHHDMVSVFQSISPGETVKLEVCRGYPLPFDPNDPNTEVVTTVAVGAPESDNNNCNAFIEQDLCLKNNSLRGNTHNNANDLTNHSVKSMPDLYSSEKMLNIERPNSTDLILEEEDKKPEYLTMPIVKGAMGFGFTIADSAYGQKVKKILDRHRCENLMEGDILIDINNICLRNMCHAEVVQVLKDCARNKEAAITVQRGGPRVRSKPELKPGPYRSKTPTVDVYGSRPKEIVVSRPKTPLIDTRSRPKTPTRPTDEPPQESDLYNMDNSSHLDYSRSHSPGNELDHNENNWNNKIPHHSNDYMSRVPPHGVYYNGYLEPSERSYCLDMPNQQQPYYNDCFKKRKETTSFEHEQPLSNTDLRYSGQDMVLQNNMGLNRVENHPRIHTDVIESTITLIRQETGFGFRIVGGTEEGSQVSIGHIVPGGAADLDGRLCTGDEIVSVDGQSVINTSHHHVVQLMAKASRVILGIRRRVCIPAQAECVSHCSTGSDQGLVKLSCKKSCTINYDLRKKRCIICGCKCHEISLSATNNEGVITSDEIQYDTMNVYPYDVTVKRNENEGFGFVIISSLNKAGSTIGRIIEGSPAERCGQLHLGDHILAVNGVNIMSLHHGDIVNLIKDSGYSVTLTIGPPLDDASSTASMTASHRQEDVNEGEEQYHAVELNRGSRGFGFSIRGGREFQNMALFVLQIAENGPAALDGRLKIGDQIIEINGINTKNMTHAEAIEIIRNGGPSVRLLVRRGGRVPPIPLEEQMMPGNNLLPQQPNSLMCLNMTNSTY